MAAAVIRASYYGGSASEPAGVTAETGIKFNREDTQSGTTNPVPVPQSTGTNYSWIKLLAFEVTTAGTTSVSNYRIYLSGALTTGLHLWFAGQATYRQPASGNKPADSGTNGATPTPAGTSAPASYTAVTATTQAGAHQWYNTPAVSTGTTGRKGDFIELVFGVANNYTGGAGDTSLATLNLVYDEA